MSEDQQMAQLMAVHLYGTLQQFYPLRDPKELQQMAMYIVREQAKLGPIAAAFVEKKYTHIELQLVGSSKIHLPGMPPVGAKLLAPLRLEDCKDLEEVIKSITIFSIVGSPVAQALLRLNGYKIAIGLATAQKRDVKAELAETAEDEKKEE